MPSKPFRKINRLGLLSCLGALISICSAHMPDALGKQRLQRMRIMHIDLDYVYDTDKAQQRENLQALIQRIQAIQPNTVFLQAFADPDANGSADQVYFPNRHIPVREDLFHQVLQQIRQQTKVKAVAFCTMTT